MAAEDPVVSPTLSLDQLTDEITHAQYREAADTFCRLVAEEDQPLREVVHTAIGAAAPFVQVPSHLMQQPGGELRGVNYDHTILGWRGALALIPRMNDPRRAVLPTVQAMWYVPQGLNIWEQIICEFPGHYARDAEKCNTKSPGPDPEVNRFDGPAWQPPKIHFEDHEPIRGGSVEERLDRFNLAIAEGNRAESYGLFLGLAEDPANRARLKERLLFAGITDLQDTLINRGGYQNIGHKALRARALIDIADYFGWDAAREVIYTVVPDLGCSPRLYGLWTEINNLVKIELPNAARIPRRGESPMTERELDELADALLWGGPFEVNDCVMRLYRGGRGILDITDGVAVGYQRYLIDVLEHPSLFNHPMHAFDYLNVVNTWIRTYDSPHQVKAAFMVARFVNDAFRSNAMSPRDPVLGLPSRFEFRAWADAMPLERLLGELLEHILVQDAPRACALADSYLERTAERQALMDTITYAACHFQNDPHVMRNCASSVEEFTYNQTPRRDDILRGFVKHQARYVKRATNHAAFNLYARYFDDSAILR
jgi:hypothetical protein